MGSKKKTTVAQPQITDNSKQLTDQYQQSLAAIQQQSQQSIDTINQSNQQAMSAIQTQLQQSQQDKPAYHEQLKSYQS